METFQNNIIQFMASKMHKETNPSRHDYCDLNHPLKSKTLKFHGPIKWRKKKKDYQKNGWLLEKETMVHCEEDGMTTKSNGHNFILDP